jgi:hypothetical protein
MDVEHSVDTLLDLRAATSSSSNLRLDSSWDEEEQQQQQLLTQIRSYSASGELLVQFETAAAAKKALQWASAASVSILAD